MRVAEDVGAALQIATSLSFTIIPSFVIWAYCGIINLCSAWRELLQV